MKKLIILIFAITAAATVAHAQEIAVQAADGSVATYNNLDKAILGAPAGATIYLPAGNLTINDSVIITKKLTIIGVGYKTTNQGGSTLIGGNFHYDQGSDGSSLMGVYLTGEVRLAFNGAINNFLLRFCNVNQLIIGSGWNLSNNIFINQNIIRASIYNTFCSYWYSCFFGPIHITNNIIGDDLNGVNGGIVDHNIFLNLGSTRILGNKDVYGYYIKNTTFSNNVFYFSNDNLFENASCLFQNNIGVADLATDLANNDELNKIFVNGTGKIDGDYHIKDGMTGKGGGTDGTDVGIYGGSGFSDEALAPIPRIVSKSIPNQTDASGNLNISIKVRAAQ